MRRIIAAAACLATLAAPLADAKTLRWSSQGDYLTADPMAQNELLTNSINGHVYEPLVTRGKKLEILPALAVKWEQKDPKTWIFHLRKGVKWHDGTDFTADDVVFSIKRLQGKTSNFRVYGNAVGEPSKIDSHTVQLVTPVPNPVMLEMLANSLFMMSKAWAEKNNAVKAQDFTNEKEAYTARNAMGTGPYILVSRDPDVKSVFKKNPNWWGLKEKGYWDGNVDEIVYSPIKEGNTRMSALLSGQLDFVLDPPVQDVPKLREDAAIWVSWPKKVSRVPTDITEDRIREVALPLGLVDIKVCAVDEVWSALKLVLRKEVRAPGARSRKASRRKQGRVA